MPVHLRPHESKYRGEELIIFESKPEEKVALWVKNKGRLGMNSIQKGFESSGW